MKLSVTLNGKEILDHKDGEHFGLSLAKMGYTQLMDIRNRSGGTDYLDYDISFFVHMLTNDNAEELAQQYMDMMDIFHESGKFGATKKEYAEALGWNIEVLNFDEA